MKNGFIYPIFDKIIVLLKYFSLVELFKYIAIKFFADDSAESKRYKARIAIDLFQLFKWLLIIVFYVFCINSMFSLYVTYYLIWANIYSYFYYHVWGSGFTQQGDFVYFRSRFLNSILAIAYFIFCYAYLYTQHFPTEIVWANDEVDFINGIYLSVSNSFTLTYGDFAPKTQFIRVLFLTELLNTFVFFTIILSNSIPNPTSKEND